MCYSLLQLQLSVTIAGDDNVLYTGKTQTLGSIVLYLLCDLSIEY